MAGWRRGKGRGRLCSGEQGRRRRGPRGQRGSGAQGAPVEGLGGAWGGRKGLVGDGPSAVVEVSGGCGIPAMDWREGEAGDLRWSKAKLVREL